MVKNLNSRYITTGEKYFRNNYLFKFYCFWPRLYLLICFFSVEIFTQDRNKSKKEEEKEKEGCFGRVGGQLIH